MVRAIVVGDSRGEGVAVAALGIVAAITAAYRAVTRRARRRRERKGNVTDAMAARFAAAEKNANVSADRRGRSKRRGSIERRSRDTARPVARSSLNDGADS